MTDDKQEDKQTVGTVYVNLLPYTEHFAQLLENTAKFLREESIRIMKECTNPQ